VPLLKSSRHDWVMRLGCVRGRFRYSTGAGSNELSTVPANPSQSQLAPRYSSTPYRSQQTLKLFLRCGPVAAFALSQITSRYLVRGLPSTTGSACGQASTPVFVQLDVLTLVRRLPCIIIVVSISDKWEYAHAIERWKGPEYITIIGCQ